MTSLQRQPDKSTGEMPTPLLNAAMQYADNEIPVVVFDTTTGKGKSCGNLVGDAGDDDDKWYRHVTSDKAVIRGWLDEFGARATGIATSPGAADCVVLDVDRPDEVPAHWWQWLTTAVFQSTRTDDDRRGHYWFDQPPGERIGCPVMAWGEVRGDGGGLILSPTPHAKANGRYQWIRQGDTQPLPDAIATTLRAKGQRQGGVVRLVTTTDVSEFIAAHTTPTRPGALAAIVEDFHLSRKGKRKRHGKVEDRKPLNRHDAEFSSLCRIARGAAVDKISASEGRDTIETASREECEQRGEVFQPDDFQHSWIDAIRRALLTDPDALAARENRVSGTDTRDTTAAPDIESVLAKSGIDSGKSPDEAADNDAEESFWSSSPQLRDLRQFAYARMVGRWAMLGNALARVIAHVPPHVVLPPTVGDYASLNLFVAVVGRSGDSKSASMAAAGSWLHTEPDYPPSKPGSGEGLAKCFAYVRKLPANQGGGTVQAGKQWSVLAKIPEVDTLTATAARGGATIMSTLREGWSGERLGTDYAADEKRIVLEANRYRLCLVIGVQPGRAGALFDDAEGGTPQRILWLPSADPDMPETEPDEPPALDLGRWERHAPTSATPSIVPLDVDAERNRLLADRADSAKFDVLAIPDVARDLIKDTRRAVARGDASVDPLDGHKLLVQLKIAAALMALEGRRTTITEDDWKRAGIVIAVSDRTRASVLHELHRSRTEVNRSRGADEAVREMTKSKVISAERQRVAAMAQRIVNKLSEKDGQSLSVLRRGLSANDNRDAFDDAVTYAAELGKVRREEFVARNGQDGTRLWVSSANESGVS